MKEEIKIALLAIIAGTLIVQTYMQWNSIETTTPSSTISGTLNNNPNNPSQITTANPEATAPSRPSIPPTAIKFMEESFDFGTIKQDTENKHVFKFRNMGSNPLVIENAHGSCGCTVPTWPKEPVAPGAEGEIEVIYKPGKQQGKQTKTVTVSANTEPKETRVAITSEVEVPPGTGTQ